MTLRTPRLLARASTWLLAVGWRKHGLLPIRDPCRAVRKSP